MACPFMAWRLTEAHTWTATKKKRISKINRTSDQARWWGQEPHSFSHTRFVVSKNARFQCFDESWRVSLVVCCGGERRSELGSYIYPKLVTHDSSKINENIIWFSFWFLLFLGSQNRERWEMLLLLEPVWRGCADVKMWNIIVIVDVHLVSAKVQVLFADSEKCGEAKWLKNDLRIREKKIKT